MGDADFDFVSYLSTVLSIPLDHITVNRLTGGHINLTVRAIFSPPADFSCIGQTPQFFDSVILKYATPFTVSNPTQTVSLERQAIEARALTLMSPDCGIIPGVSSLRAKYPSVKIPRLVHLDEERRVIWITDLGTQTRMVLDWLTSEPGPSPHDIERIASTTAQFLAEFASITRNPPADILPNLKTVGQFYEFLGSTPKKVLDSSGVDVPDAGILTARAIAGLEDCGKVEPCIGMVDMWHGCILVHEDGSCGLVDFEWFGLSDAGNELGMFGKSSSFLRLCLRHLSIG